MTEADVASIRPRAPPVVRARFYRSLAFALAATRPPAGVVFEATSLDSVPWLTVRPAALVATVRAATDATVVSRLETGVVPPSPKPPPGSSDRFGVLVPNSAGTWTPPAPTGWAPEATSYRNVLGSEGWLGVQTFWVRAPLGRIAVARRFRVATGSDRDLDARFDATAIALARDWGELLKVLAVARPTRRAVRGWRQGSPRALPSEAWIARSPVEAATTAEIAGVADPVEPTPLFGPTIVFGASGAGKTSYLARCAAGAIEARERVVTIDLHGDLAPAIVGLLCPEARDRTIAVDATERPVPGISALPPIASDGEREAAHLVAALKRLTPDGTDLYWGFRLERIFDTFVRLVIESHGSLLDLFGLLTSADRRDAARLATRRVDLARFLDELGPVLRRNPEFLWSAATRLSKVVLVPALGELLAPAEGGLPVESLLSGGDSLLVRLPFAALGPEAAAFAGTLVLGRVYLGIAAQAQLLRQPPRILFVLDEVHGFSPRLVAELLTESRKFGIRTLVATQYPDRLPPEVRSAAAGALAGFVAFRVPHPTARDVGAWLGLPTAEAEGLLPELPPGHAVATSGDSLGARLIAATPEEQRPDPDAWKVAVEATRARFPSEANLGDEPSDPETLDERLLLAVLAAEEEGRPLAPSEVVAAAYRLPGPEVDPVSLADRWSKGVGRAGVSVTDDGCRLIPAGERLLGLGTPTGATRESAEHRMLLIRAFRLFARHGYRLEILRQGRYDTTLPDALFRQIPADRRHAPPGELAAVLARARSGWAWRFFGGRDVHVEAEVSGALRPERIRHGVAKAKAHGAFSLFLVGDAERARRVRATLRGLGLGSDRAQVWTLATPLPRGQPPANP